MLVHFRVLCILFLQLHAQMNKHAHMHTPNLLTQPPCSQYNTHKHTHLHTHTDTHYPHTLSQIMSQDSGVNLRVYCFVCLFFLSGTCISEWMLEPHSYCLHRSLLLVGFCPYWGWKSQQKPRRVVKGTITIDIRYTNNFFFKLYTYFKGVFLRRGYILK